MSMLWTMEVILGLSSSSLFCAATVPMTEVSDPRQKGWTSSADFAAPCPLRVHVLRHQRGEHCRGHCRGIPVLDPTVETAAPPCVIPDAPAECVGPAIGNAPATKIKNSVPRLSMANSPSADFAGHGMCGAPSMNPLRDAVHASVKRYREPLCLSGKVTLSDMQSGWLRE